MNNDKLMDIREERDRLTEERDKLLSRVKELETDNAKMKESDEDRYPSMCRYAADLRAEIDRLRAALKPFAERAAYYEQRSSDNEDNSVGCVTLGDLRRAAIAFVKGGTK